MAFRYQFADWDPLSASMVCCRRAVSLAFRLVSALTCARLGGTWTSMLRLDVATRAASSARSLPLMEAWPGIHRREILVPIACKVCAWWKMLVRRLILSEGWMCLRACREAFESVAMSALRGLSSKTYSSAPLMATSSVCSDDALSVTRHRLVTSPQTNAAPAAPVSWSTEPSVYMVKEDSVKQRYLGYGTLLDVKPFMTTHCFRLGRQCFRMI